MANAAEIIPQSPAADILHIKAEYFLLQGTWATAYTLIEQQ
jgi:hypothetical protein